MRLATLTCTYVCVYFILVKGDGERPVEIDRKSCTTAEECDIVLENIYDEETKYWMENDLTDLHIQIDGDSDTPLGNVDDNQEVMTDTQFEPQLPNEVTQASDTTNSETLKQKSAEENVAPAPEQPQSLYEFPPLTRIDPVKVGHEAEVELEKGEIYTRVTRAVQPPVFEVLDFLSPEECDQFIEAGRQLGLETSGLFGADVDEEKKRKEDNSEITRISDQTWLRPNNLPGIWDSLMKRLAAALEMPVEFVQRSEPIQLVKYKPGGHYHAHMDTTDTVPMGTSDLPCCFQAYCGTKENTAQWSECCRLCRYMTVMYYLSDVEEGGETAFPLADMKDNLYKEKTTDISKERWFNLSKYCYNSSLVVTPRKGSAIIWYSHFRDEETSYLGASDKRSYHGGCDLIKGTKWIANNFISAAPYQDRFKPSVWYTGS